MWMKNRKATKKERNKIWKIMQRIRNVWLKKKIRLTKQTNPRKKERKEKDGVRKNNRYAKANENKIK